MTERDPNNTPQHDAGAKLDADKVRPDLIFSGMPRALLAVAEVATFGAQKYTENGWMSVPDGVKRYTAAMDRHRLASDERDEQSGLLHAAHLAWNALARLELMLREQDKRREEWAQATSSESSAPARDFAAFKRDGYKYLFVQAGDVLGMNRLLGMGWKHAPEQVPPAGVFATLLRRPLEQAK